MTPWVLRRADQPGRRGMMGDHPGDEDLDDHVGDQGNDEGDVGQ
jgi:hypothetical protein